MTDVLERVKTYQQFIGGEWVDSASGETLDVENPADGTVIARVQASSAEDVDRAANAASIAFETWGHTTPAERSGMLLKLADALEARGEEIGRLESKNAGKPVGAAIDELLADGPLARRLIEMSTRIKSARGTVRAADLIERVARTGEPVLAG